ncbi:MAG: pilus assembly protein PilM [Candidatus Omnitrophica bacterium]|nr:pilus assembly protein PilM [Candidatus Omnitrophota bacterium]
MIGIDLSQHSIKLAQFERGGPDVYKLVRLGIASVPLDENIPREEQIKRQQTLLRNLKKECGIKDRSEVVVSLASSSVFIRYLEILRSAKKKEKDFITFEAKQQIPFPIEEVAWDYFNIRAKNAENKQAVLMAVKNELIAESRQIIEAADLKCDFINLGLINAMNFCLLNRCLKKNEMGIVVDIGADTTGVVIYRRGELWLRSFSLGGYAITKEIAASLGISAQQAEAIKKQSPEELENTNKDAGQKVRDIVIANLSKIGSEVERSISFFKTEQERKHGASAAVAGEEAVRVLLCGAMGQMSGIGEFFQHHLGLTTSLLSFGSRMQVPATIAKNIALVGDKDRTFDDDTIPAYFGVAMGAALARKGKVEITINFLRNTIESGAHQRSKKMFGVLGAACLVIGAGIFLMFSLLALKTDQGRLEAAEAVLQKYTDYRNDVITIGKEKQRMRGEARFFLNYASKRYIWLDAMKSIAEIVPLNIWIEEMYGKADLSGGEVDTIEMKGYMLSYDDFNAFIANIKRIKSIKEVKPEAIESGEGQFKFVLNIKLRSVLDRAEGKQ